MRIDSENSFKLIFISRIIVIKFRGNVQRLLIKWNSEFLLSNIYHKKTSLLPFKMIRIYLLAQVDFFLIYFQANSSKSALLEFGKLNQAKEYLRILFKNYK